jgi:Transposase DDE domain
LYFKSSIRTNPATGHIQSYFRLIESYRNDSERVCHRTIVNLGFIDSSITPEQLNAVSRRLTDMYHLKKTLFINTDSIVQELVSKLWTEIRSNNKLDLKLYEPNNRKVDVDTLKHSDVREVGAEWLCYNAWQELGIDKVLEENNFTEAEIKLTQTQIISRAIYPSSELATSKLVVENSAITELTGFDVEKINKDRLYRGALKLSEVHQQIQHHLSIKTNELFDIKDKIMLYDLTNTYFEGEKRNSKLAKHGRSKEKRSDAKLVVLALVVNIYGFIKYSSIHEGNMSDSADLLKIITHLDKATGTQKPLVVIDAGVATEDNLKLLIKNGYNYLCVSRSKPKDIIFDSNRLTTIYSKENGTEVRLKNIESSSLSGHLLEVYSKKKELKEDAMQTQFITRYELELEKIKNALTKKSGVKTIAKVHERIGRAKQRYPSVHNLFEIKTTEDSKKITTISWIRKENMQPTAKVEQGKYFLRTNLKISEEVIVWEAYNTIREIESTFKLLKTDLDLRPIYHKNDDSTIAHLNLGLLAYWLVNTIRQKLKRNGFTKDWNEIKRIASTQKVITTTGINTAGKEITIRKCSEPNQSLRNLQELLKIKPRPFTKLKSVVHRPKRVTAINEHQLLLGT